MEPPLSTDPEEVENAALREVKSSTAGPTVWSEFSALAAETGGINLGQVYECSDLVRRSPCIVPDLSGCFPS